MKNKEKIIVCENCNLPLIWTFHWVGAEYYCLNCGNHRGMLGNDELEATSKLKRQKKSINRFWKVLANYHIPVSSFTRSRCKQCKNAYSHTQHLSKKEIRDNKMATKILSSLIGCFN